jgi:hypothetical protein
VLKKKAFCADQQDISVQDFDGVKLLPGGSNWDWTVDHSGPLAGQKRPGDMFCKTFQAWSALLKAAGTAAADAPLTEPMRYDLIVSSNRTTCHVCVRLQCCRANIRGHICLYLVY